MQFTKETITDVKIQHYDPPKFKNILKMNMITNKIHNYKNNHLDNDKQVKVKAYQIKIKCNVHNNKYMYKCQHPECKEPYICPNQECIEEHFHNNQIVMSKFDLSVFKEKYDRMQECIENYGNLSKMAMRIKNTIDHFKASVINLSKDIVTMNSIIGDIKSEVDDPLTNGFIQKIDEAVIMEQRINQAIESFRSQIIMNSPTVEKVFFMKNEIIEFLEVNIPNFSWNSATTIFNSHKKKEIEVRSFHKMLQRKKNLVFLLIGNKTVIITYISSNYPSFGNTLKDDFSFIVIASQIETKNKLSKFIANPDLEYHISADDNSYVNHGLSHEYGDGLYIPKDDLFKAQYKLPSLSFIAENVVEYYQGSIKLQQILIVQSETIIE